MMLDLEGMHEYVLNDRIAEITSPVDLLWGESDQFMDLEYAAAMDALLPRSRLTRIGSCGHIPHTECPDRFLDVFRQVLDLGPPQLSPETVEEE
jgi:pimeloyl-ACP methyl ester carboxylesterase